MEVMEQLTFGVFNTIFNIKPSFTNYSISQQTSIPSPVGLEKKCQEPSVSDRSHSVSPRMHYISARSSLPFIYTAGSKLYTLLISQCFLNFPFRFTLINEFQKSSLPNPRRPCKLFHSLPDLPKPSKNNYRIMNLLCRFISKLSLITSSLH